MHHFSALAIKHSMFGNLTKDPESRSKIKNKSEQEWNDFLVNRAKELAPGNIKIIVHIVVSYEQKLHFVLF